MTPPIDVINVSKVYRRYAQKKQFATLKSAILNGSLLGDLKPDETFQALRRRVVLSAEGLHLRRDRPQRLRQEHAAEVRGRHHASDRRRRQGRWPHLGADRARRRLPSGNLRPREHLHQRHHAGPHEEGDPAPLRRDRRVRGDAGLHRRAGEDVFVRHVHAPRLRRGGARRSRSAARRRSAGGRRPGLHAQVPRQVRGVPAAQQVDPAGDALARPGREVLRHRALARSRRHQRRRRSQARRRRLRHRRRRHGRERARESGSRSRRGVRERHSKPRTPRTRPELQFDRERRGSGRRRTARPEGRIQVRRRPAGARARSKSPT